MGNLCPAQKAALDVFVADVAALFDELVRGRASTVPAVAALHGAKMVLDSSPDALKVKLANNWHEVATVDMADRSLEEMLKTDYLDVPGVITGAQMLAVYHEHPEAQQQVLRAAFEKSIASCCAFHDVPAEGSA